MNSGVLPFLIRSGRRFFIWSIKDVTEEKEYVYKDIASSYNMYKRKTMHEVAETFILASYIKKIA